MAKLLSPLMPDQVQTLRGVVDLYYYRGVPVARAWPRPPRQPNTHAQTLTRTRMKTAVSIAGNAPASWVNAWRELPQTPGRTYRDRYISTLLRALALGPVPTLPDIARASLAYDPGAETSRLTVHVANPTETDINRWIVYARGQPPGSPPLSYYDAGWHHNRCRALYKDYRPIWFGFKQLTWAPESTPAEWIANFPAVPDALVFCLTPYRDQQPTLEETDAIIPPAYAHA